MSFERIKKRLLLFRLDQALEMFLKQLLNHLKFVEASKIISLREIEKTNGPSGLFSLTPGLDWRKDPSFRNIFPAEP
eukprot:snap_masked-scaffold_103-processed-gene-0.15-mRNA-1 protein AED:1.00 eAED:1.00 QI:0/0/0/0/1/1/2/0/76